jgi:hypothetical protein
MDRHHIDFAEAQVSAAQFSTPQAEDRKLKLPIRGMTRDLLG